MRAAVFGAGRMGRRHVEVIRQLGLDLVGICDVSPQALDIAAAESNAPREHLFTDAKTLLAQARPECVVVSTTAPSHCEYACLAAESGVKYVLVEKPMAVSLAECDRMLEVCGRHGAKLAVNHQMRFMEQYTEPKRIVQSEAFGGLSSITVIGGNFGVAMNGTHYFEMFRYLTDEAPIEVCAWFSPEKVSNPRGAQYEDRAGSVRVTTPSGKRLYVEVGADQGHGLQVIYAGRCGQLVVDELAGTMRQIVREASYRDLPTTRYGMPAEVSELTIRPADVIAPSCAVLDALLTGSNPPSGLDGRLAVEVLVAAYESAENGNRAVRLDAASLPRARVFPWA